LCDLASANLEFDIVFLAVKSNDHRWMAEFISGLVVRKGKELGIPTPCNEAVVEIDRQINNGLLKMDRSNFELLKEKVAQQVYASSVRRL
jgi:hypothetical protein